MIAVWIALALAWIAIAAVVAVVVGRATRLRDERDARPTRRDNDSENKAS
jgi:heme exporter protein D